MYVCLCVHACMCAHVLCMHIHADICVMHLYPCKCMSVLMLLSLVLHLHAVTGLLLSVTLDGPGFLLLLLLSQVVFFKSASANSRTHP